MKILSLEEINREFTENRVNPPHSQTAQQEYQTTLPESTISSLTIEPSPTSNDKNKLSAQQPVSSIAPADIKHRRRTFSITAIIISFCAVLGIIITIGVWTGSFGYSLFRVTSGSMQREIPEGSLIITKKFDPRRIIVGDTITYRKEDGSTVTHKVIDIIENDDVSQFQTQGTENPIADSKLVAYENVVGLVIYHAAGLGNLFSALKGVSLLLSSAMIVLAVCLYLRGRQLKTEKKHGSGPRAYKSYAVA